MRLAIYVKPAYKYERPANWNSRTNDKVNFLTAESF